MKKLFNLLGIFAIGSGLFLTSCDTANDVLDTVSEPTISVVGADTTTLNIGDSIMFVANVTSATDLTSFTALSNSVGATIQNSPFTVAGLTSTVSVWVKVETLATAGELITVSFKVANGSKEASTMKYIKVNAELPLSAETAFTWERIGGAEGSGLDVFGLKWTNNTTSFLAEIKKNDDKFVELAASTWTSITTATALKAAIDAGTPLTSWTGVSVNASASYDKVLGTKKGAEYFLIHVTNATISSVTAGTKVVITGKYKK